MFAVRHYVCCPDTKILRIRQSHFEFFFSMAILEKTEKYIEKNLFARLKSRYKSVLFTGLQLLILSCVSFQGKSMCSNANQLTNASTNEKNCKKYLDYFDTKILCCLQTIANNFLQKMQELTQ